MDPQQQQQKQQQQQTLNEDNSGSNSGKGGNFLCSSRQSSTRWTPTTDQIRILKDLYYNNGVRSPTAEQIQRISARLRQYGKIEGKNVFYWFQNHKARERQKKRFTSTTATATDVSMQRPLVSAKHEDSIHNKYPNIITSPSPGFSSASQSSPGMITANGQMGHYVHGSVNMEKSFRDCSISSASSSSTLVGGGTINHNKLGWVGFDPYSSSCALFDKRNPIDEEDEEEEEEDEQEQEEYIEYQGREVIVTAPDLETLPLFPMHGEDINGGRFCSNFKQPSSSEQYYYRGDWYRSSDDHHHKGSSRASLELSLNSYFTGRSPEPI